MRQLGCSYYLENPQGIQLSNILFLVTHFKNCLKMQFKGHWNEGFAEPQKPPQNFRNSWSMPRILLVRSSPDS